MHLKFYWEAGFIIFCISHASDVLLMQIKLILALIYDKLKLKQILQPPIIASVSFSLLNL
jgi:hypothetical protein